MPLFRWFKILQLASWKNCSNQRVINISTFCLKLLCLVWDNMLNLWLTEMQTICSTQKNFTRISLTNYFVYWISIMIAESIKYSSCIKFQTFATSFRTCWFLQWLWSNSWYSTWYIKCKCKFQGTILLMKADIWISKLSVPLRRT